MYLRVLQWRGHLFNLYLNRFAVISQLIYNFGTSLHKKDINFSRIVPMAAIFYSLLQQSDLNEIKYEYNLERIRLMQLVKFLYLKKFKDFPMLYMIAIYGIGCIMAIRYIGSIRLALTYFMACSNKKHLQQVLSSQL